MTEHCILILAHKEPSLFERLVDRMAPYMTVLAHIDAQASNRERFTAVPQVTIIPQAHRIQWGSFAMVAAALDLIRFGLSQTGAMTFTLISGDSYPLIHPRQLVSRLDECTNMMFYNIIERGNKFYQRIENIYLPDTRIGDVSPGLDALYRHIDTDLTDMIADAEMARRERETFLSRFSYAKGSQWWSLNRGAAEAIVSLSDRDPLFFNAMRFSAIPDEAFFQTAAVALGLDHRSYYGPMYDNWEHYPAPHTFRKAAEIQILRGQKKFFARKFSDESDDLLDQIEAKVWYRDN